MGDALSEKDAFGFAVFGCEGELCRNCVSRRSNRGGFAFDLDLAAASLRMQAKQSLQELCASCAHEPEDSEDLAFVDLQRDIFHDEIILPFGMLEGNVLCAKQKFS